jgi:hypothetical protein
MGSVDDRVALALFGFAVATGALSVRWWQLQRMPSKLPERAAIVYLEAEQTQPFYGALPDQLELRPGLSTLKQKRDHSDAGDAGSL